MFRSSISIFIFNREYTDYTLDAVYFGKAKIVYNTFCGPYRDSPDWRQMGKDGKYSFE